MDIAARAELRRANNYCASAAVAAVFWLPVIAFAQEVIPDFYKGPGLDPNRSYVNQNFNEQIDPFNGSLQLHYVDINIPGNGGFDLQVNRSYNRASVNESTPSGFFGSATEGWSVHFGRVLYKATVGLSGGSTFVDVLRDAVLELPDGNNQILAKNLTAGADFISTQRWRAGGLQLNGLTYLEGGAVSYGYRFSTSDYVYFNSVNNSQSRATV